MSNDTIDDLRIYPDFVLASDIKVIKPFECSM